MKKLLFILLLSISCNIFANSVDLSLDSSIAISSGTTSLVSALPSSIIPPSQLSLPSVIPAGVFSIVFGPLISVIDIMTVPKKQ